MSAVIANIASAAAGSPGALARLPVPATIRCICPGRTGERGLSVRSTLDRASACERALSLVGQGKEVKFFCVGRKVTSSSAASSRSRLSSMSICAARQLGFVNAEDIAKKVPARFEAGEFDVCTLSGRASSR
jgi:F-type H+-transporting ATPase subunit gamma